MSNDRKTYGWTSLFLAGAAANLAYGYWELTIAPKTDQQSGGNPCRLDRSAQVVACGAS